MIVDRYGNPLVPENLINNPAQVSRVGWLTREFSAHPSRGLTPAKLARILEDAEQGNMIAQCQLFEDMEEKDAHLAAEMSKRKRAPMGLDWSVAVPDDACEEEHRNAQIIEMFIRQIKDFEDILFDMGDGIGKGYSMLEIANDDNESGWAHIDNTWLIDTVQHRPAEWFTVPPDKRNQLRLRDNTAYGQTLQPFSWIRHIHRAKSGYVARAGLYRVLTFPYLLKNYALGDLAEFLEIYGLPVRMGKYPNNATEKEKSTLLNAVVQMGHHAAGIIPESMSIEFLEAASGQSDPFETMIRFAELSMSKAVLGGTLTSQADGKTSTNALGTIHANAMWEITVSDVRQYASTLTSDIVYPLAMLNLPNITPAKAKRFKFEFKTAEEAELPSFADALNQFALGLQKIVEMGYPVPMSYINNMLHIPMPIDNEAILIPKQPSVGAPPAAARAILKALPNPALDDWEQQIDPLLDPVKQAIMNAQNPEELLNILGSLAGEMDATELQAALTSVTFKTYVDGLGNG